MVMDAAEPRDYEIRALCRECRQFRSKKVSIKPENQEAEEMAFLLEITSSHEPGPSFLLLENAEVMIYLFGLSVDGRRIGLNPVFRRAVSIAC